MPQHVTTTAHARQARESAEQQILAILKTLCEHTGLDLDRVAVLTVVSTQDARDEPHVVPYAVKIILSV